MANLQKRPNGAWRARYRDESGKQHAKHFTRKVDAQAWLDTVTASVVRGDYVDPNAGKITLTQYADRWQKSQVVSEGTARIIDNALRVHITPALGDRRIASILRSDVQGFVKALSDRLQPGSVRNVYDVLFRVMDSAAEDRVIASNPCKRIALPKGTKGEVIPPTVEEVERVTEKTAERYRALIVLLAGSGLRIGEALGLDVGHVDFLRRRVRVERQLLQTGDFGPPKGRKPRTVPVGRVVIDALAAHLAEHPSDGAIFTTEVGERLTYRAWRYQWKTITKAAKVGFTTHDLRHFTASVLISRGASVKQVQVLLGHSSPVITLRTYAHLFPGEEDQTANVMDAVLGPRGLGDRLGTGTASI